ncbi:MAG: 1-(5-phosphoribosyl)-5-[(5-phosphoribosylamino)methylideneamino]imidazole-4-carboxamide isomerase [Cyclobacteriaceae bacterium]
MRIIPAIDIIDGKCVRLTQGDFAQKKIYNDNPLEIAKKFEDAGLKYLHLVDLDGARAGRVINWKVIESITGNTSLKVDFGGGIKTEDEINRLLKAGVQQINLGSIAVRDRDLVYHWLELFGPEKIILSADVKGEFIAIAGWQQNSNISISDFLKDYLQQGIQYVTCTDISTDGMLQGPNVTLYTKILKGFPSIKLIASGGVSNTQDLENLKKIRVDGVIVGKAIYEGHIDLVTLTARSSKQ